MTIRYARALLLAAGALAIAALALSVFDSKGTSPTSEGPRPTLDLSRPSIWSADSLPRFVQDTHGASDIDPQIHSWYAFDDSAQEYNYHYTVINKPTSQNAIWTFAVDPIPQPAWISAVEHWSNSHGFEERNNAVVWMVTDVGGAAPADWDSVSLYPGSFDVQPGDTTTGFSIRSVFPPTLVSYFVQGFYVTTPSVEEEGGGETFTLFQNSVTGLAVGPATTVGGDSGGIGSKGGLKAPILIPASGRATITFNLPKAASARLAVHDVSGGSIRVLADGAFPGGVHSAAWDGFDSNGQRVAPGVYFYKLVVDNKPAGERRVVVSR